MTLTVQLSHQIGSFALDITFEQPSSGLTALFGPSGAGKTVTINAIAGLTKPDAGKIELNGTTLFSSDTSINLSPHKRRIGYVFQDARLFPHLSIKANLLFGAKRSPRPPEQKVIDHMIELLEIGHLMNRYPANLSGGEKQRVAIGRALLSSPDLLLLDEPMAALDHRRKEEIMRLIETIRDESKSPILMVSHSISEVTRLADTMILLDQGKVAAFGKVEDLMSRLDLFPLTGRHEAGSLLTGKVIAHDENLGMSVVLINKEKLWTPRIDRQIGQETRLHIHAQDVMISLEKPQGISANNILPGTVHDWRKDGKFHVEMQLECDGTVLLARITQRSWERLALQKGMPVFAIVKSVTLLR